MRLFTGSTENVLDRPGVDIGVIYTYERDYMSRLLASLRESQDGLPVRLILVDNNSADGVRPWSAHLPETTVLRNSNRLYYSANLNRILRVAEQPYILLLNTDIYFEPGQRCVSKMIDFMESHPRCGIAGCRIYHENGEPAYPARRFQTISVILARRFGLARLLPGVLADYLYREHAVEEKWECDWLSGCFMMIRREAFQQVGYFDAGFKKYFEDVDMCLRMAKAGWQVMYNGRTYCYHLEQRSSGNLFSADARRHARSYLRWLRKWGFSPRRCLPRKDKPAVPKEKPTRRAA